jgi:hypothetical protein
MGKAPAFQFYTGDWSKDVELHMMSFQSRGIWIEMLICMWDANERGKLIGTREQLCRLIGCNLEEINTAIQELSVTKTADVTVCYDLVTIINRRMHREENERKLTRSRVKKHREEKEKRICNAKVTPPSSSSSSSSIKKEKKGVFLKPSFDDVSGYCRARKNGIDPKAWMDHYISNGWMVGKNKMKDWKAAVRTWEARKKENNNGARSTGRQFGFNRNPGPEIEQDILDTSERLRRKYESPGNAPEGEA